MKITGATVIDQDTTPGRTTKLFSLKYSQLLEVIGNLHEGKQLEIDGTYGTIEFLKIDPRRDEVYITLLAKEGIC